MPGMGVQYQGGNFLVVRGEDEEGNVVIVPVSGEDISPQFVGEGDLLPVVIHPGTAGWIPILRAKAAAVELGDGMMNGLLDLIRPAYED